MITIKKSVGKGGVNDWVDTAEIQSLLNDNMYLLPGLELLEVDGSVGETTVKAIMAYQRQILHYRNPDGKVDKGGTTLSRLNATAKSDTILAPGGRNEYIVTRANLFPLGAEPEMSYKTGMRRFGAQRGKKRLHAACDLYAPPGTPIRAMADGIVLRPVEYFYLETYALTVHHGDFIARYGEIKAQVPSGIKNGAEVKRGQVIAYIGQLATSHPMSMLHLELYRGGMSGSLSQAGNSFQRRTDLIDPTPVLDKAMR